MIRESWYWKKPLLKMAKQLRSLKTTDDLTEENLAEIERDIFIGFYSVRKLFDAVTKVTDVTKSFQIQMSWYPNLTPVNWRNNHKIDELYDLTKQHQETRDLEFIAGRIIHSFIHIPYIDEQGGLSGIFFTSDIDRNKKIYAMNIDDVIAVFERVGNDNPTNIHWSRHPNGEETTTVS